jgi:hypothetical protein
MSVDKYDKLPERQKITLKCFHSEPVKEFVALRAALNQAFASGEPFYLINVFKPGEFHERQGSGVVELSGKLRKDGNHFASKYTLENKLN